MTNNRILQLMALRQTLQQFIAYLSYDESNDCAVPGEAELVLSALEELISIEEKNDGVKIFS